MSPLRTRGNSRLSTPGFGEMNRDRPQSLNGERRLGRGGHPGQPLTNRAQVGGGDGLLGEEPVEEPLIGQGLDQASVDPPGCAGLRNFDQGVAESLTFLDERPGLVARTPRNRDDPRCSETSNEYPTAVTGIDREQRGVSRWATCTQYAFTGMGARRLCVRGGSPTRPAGLRGADPSTCDIGQSV